MTSSFENVSFMDQTASTTMLKIKVNPNLVADLATLKYNPTIRPFMEYVKFSPLITFALLRRFLCLTYQRHILLLFITFLKRCLILRFIGIKLQSRRCISARFLGFLPLLILFNLNRWLFQVLSLCFIKWGITMISHFYLSSRNLLFILFGMHYSPYYSSIYRKGYRF